MSEWLLVLVGAAYLVTAADLWQRGQIGLAITFACYCLANLGMILAIHGK